jgi:hypothetical protein
MENCERCNGTGEGNFFGSTVLREQCSVCDGTGKVEKQFKQALPLIIPEEEIKKVYTRTWKPLDVGGLRLYKVELRYWYKLTKENPTPLELWQIQQGHCDTYIVAHNAPRKAAEYIEKIYKEMYDANERISHWNTHGFPLQVCFPTVWEENGVPCPDCEPEIFRMGRFT